MSDLFKGTKPAFVWAFASHPTMIGYPGVIADLFFSSREEFTRIFGERADKEILVPVTVPENFTDWDYIPENY